MIITPNALASIADKAGRILDPWWSYLQQFAQPPSPIIALVPTLSPYAYTAREPGSVFVSGGTVSAVTWKRGVDTLALGVAINQLIPVCIGDIVTVTYTVLPAVKFVPNYASRRNA